jgi:hypothetical protein
VAHPSLTDAQHKDGLIDAEGDFQRHPVAIVVSMPDGAAS